VVRTCPAYFQLDGVPSDEALSEWNFVAEAERHEPEFTKPTPPIPAGEAVVCLTSFSAGLSGRKVVKGQRLRRDDPLVQEHPAFFATFQPLTESSAPASL
jgi:hypothetical protein